MCAGSATHRALRKEPDLHHSRHVLQAVPRMCAANEVEYSTPCGTSSCGPGDRELESTCDGCSCVVGFGAKERCCKKRTSSPTPPPNVATFTPATAPPRSVTKSSNCGLREPYVRVTSLSEAASILKVASVSGRIAVRIVLQSDEALRETFIVGSNASVELIGAGHVIRMDTFGIRVEDGRLCLHDVELTGATRITALLILGASSVVNMSHSAISHCTMEVPSDRVMTEVVEALDVCGMIRDFVTGFKSAMFNVLCSQMPVYVQQCCDPSTAQNTYGSDSRFFGKFAPGNPHLSHSLVAMRRHRRQDSSCGRAFDRCRARGRRAAYGQHSFVFEPYRRFRQRRGFERQDFYPG
jgi:hypothetical protein